VHVVPAGFERRYDVESIPVYHVCVGLSMRVALLSTAARYCARWVEMMVLLSCYDLVQTLNVAALFSMFCIFGN
jgi:hypothetical protein